jgi:hypothetical protein
MSRPPQSDFGKGERSPSSAQRSQFNWDTLVHIFKNFRFASDSEVHFQQFENSILIHILGLPRPTERLSICLELCEGDLNYFYLVGKIKHKISRGKFLQALIACNDANKGGLFGGRLILDHKAGSMEAEVIYVNSTTFHNCYTDEYLKDRIENCVDEAVGLYYIAQKKHKLF